MGAFDSVFDGKPPAINRPPVTARIVRSDTTGVWAVPLGGDTRHPIGPCRGSIVPVGTVVALVWTQGQAWVFGGFSDFTQFETKSGAQAKVNAGVATHSADTTDVHGIVDTAQLETKAGATTKVNVAIAALIDGAPGTLDTLNEIAAALADDDSEIAAIMASLATKETPAGAQAKADTAAADAITAHLTARHGDTGLRRVVDTATLVDLPDMVVLLRRVGPVVTVYTREPVAAAFAGTVDLYTLPTGFRLDADATVAGVYNPATGVVAGSDLVVLAAGTCRLTATSGARHYAAVTGTTSDAWPGALPGTVEV